MKQPLAYVHPEAQIADNVVIEPFVTIDKNVVIEEGTRIGSNVTILEGAHIGKNCKIFPGAVISAVPQDLKFRGEKSIVKIGDNTTIRECATVNRGTAAKGVTQIGNNCLIMAYSHIAHDCLIGNNCIITNACQLAGEVVVDDFAIRIKYGKYPVSRLSSHWKTPGGADRWSSLPHKKAAAVRLSHREVRLFLSGNRPVSSHVFRCGQTDVRQTFRPG